MEVFKLFLVIGLFFTMAGCAGENTTTQKDEEKQVETENKTSKENEPEKQQVETPTGEDKEEKQIPEEPKNNEEPEKKTPADSNNEEPEQVENPDSIEVLVNKQHLLPESYEPSDLVKPDVPFYFEEDLPKRYMREEAAEALEKLFEAARAEGLNLVGASGYRSYERQKQIYESNVAKMGKEAADKVSAFPGASEHQTGLAIDVTSSEMGYGLDQAFGDTEEGKWLANHAYQYGFIIRYPEGRTEVTGYSYEPWHLRYVGKKAAEEIHKNNLVLEEYVKQ